MKSSKEVPSQTLQKPFEPTIEEQISEFKEKVKTQIPVSTIKLSYHPEIPNGERIKILSSRHASEILRSLYNPDTLELHEEFKVLMLNNSNHIIGIYNHSKGGITGALADIRLILATALGCAAVAVIVSHNHPSGTLKPSSADKALTKKINRATGTMDIKLLDHIIITKESYYSFADENMLYF